MTEPSDRYVILLDGELTPTPRLARQIAGSRVIAADGGMRHAASLGVAAELWVGDFDSSAEGLLATYVDTPRQDHPSRKSVSDGELAINQAVAAGARSLVLCGALAGERTDHMLFHVLLSARIAEEHGIDVLLTSGREEAVPLLPGATLMPDFPVGTTFSVAAFSDLKGLSIENADWPLDAIEVAMGSSHTLSNRAGDGLKITLEQGIAAVVASFDL